MLTALLVYVLTLAAAGEGMPAASENPASSGSGVSESWVYDLPNACDALPLVAVQQDALPLPVLVPTRLDAQTWMLSESGALLRTIPSDRGGVGSPVPAGKAGSYVLEDVTGRITVVNLAQVPARSVQTGARPIRTGGLCTADLNADAELDILRASLDGLVTAYDGSLVPIWQFDAGAPILRAPAVAPLFEHTAAVYIYTADGAIVALRGDGTPMWRLITGHPDYENCRGDGPLIVQLHRQTPSLVFTDMQGGVYAVDAVTGRLQWRTQVAGGDMGGVAIIDGPQPHMRQIVAVGDQGVLAVLDVNGAIVRQAALPKGAYVPRPLAADVDADGTPEVLVAERAGGLIVAALDATVKQRISTRGCAVAGMIMEDLDQNGQYELLAATDAARVYCLSTKASGGWTHPRASAQANGYVSAISRMPLPEPEMTQRRIRLESVAIPDYEEGAPYTALSVRADAPAATHRAMAVVRNSEGPVGSSVVQPVNRAFSVPCVRLANDTLHLDVRFLDKEGKLLAISETYEVRTTGVRLVSLPAVERFLDEVSVHAARYAPPDSWRLPNLQGRTAWHLLSYGPNAWNTYGLGQSPMVADAMPYIDGLPTGNGHPAKDLLTQDSRPFLLRMSRDPQWRCSTDAAQALVAAAGPRFLGFYAPNLDLGYREAVLGIPAMRAPLAAHLQTAMMTIMESVNVRSAEMLWAGQANTVFHHQAFEWGARGAFTQVGNEGACASMHFAFLRGAARQYGRLPWGVEVRNTYEGASTDGRFRPDGTAVVWSGEGKALGLNCGHSPSLESRLEMAAHLAGSSVLHHEADLGSGAGVPSVFVRETRPGVYGLSPHGNAMKRWQEFSTHSGERGVPYTPFAFVLDFAHGWQPLQEYWGTSAEDRVNRAIGAMLNHVFATEPSNDLERGYLTSGPYGDIFDVITDNASDVALSAYGVLWPLGACLKGDSKRAAAMDFVRGGGILVLDAGTAQEFPESFLGMGFHAEGPAGTQVQMALGGNGPAGSVTAGIPFRYRALKPGKDVEVLAWTDTGAPLMAWRRVGRGLVIVCGSGNWLDERDRLLPLTRALLRTLSDAFLPIQGAGNAQLMLNRMADGWIIGLVNNNGIKKSPTQAATIDSREALDCILRFRNEVPLQFSPCFGQFQWDGAANGLSVRLQPGDVAVVKAVTAAIAR